MKLLQVELRNKESGIRILYRYEGGLENRESPIRIPAKDRDDYEVSFYVTENGEAEGEKLSVTKDYDTIAKMLSEDWDGAEKDDATLAEQLVNNFIKTGLTIDNEMVFPDFSYEDITEQELFGLPPMTANQLSDKEKGLWAWHGKRKFRFTLTAHQEEQDEKVTTRCYFDQCDNTQIDRITFDLISNATGYYSFIDTDKLGELFTDSLHLHKFLGCVERTSKYRSSSGYTVTECYPITLVVKNTFYDSTEKICAVLQPTKHVSIDFGTSSTCIAIRLGANIEMIALSPIGNDIEETISCNRFENPTNLMMFRWNKVYEEWIQKTAQKGQFPFFTKGTRADELGDEKGNRKEVHIDFGYTVKDTLKEGQKKDIDTILTELKMIPYLLDQKKQMQITPYIDEGTNTIYIVDSPEQQDGDHFDPVAFYGYLLGRAINNPASGSIYVKYDVSHPTGFNKKIRDKIQHSLAYGLKMSLPAPLHEAVDSREKPLFEVAMKYSEPEAYIGALCGTYLQCDDKPSLFAVFDFGGGTLDFSFGVFRKKEGIDGDVEIQFLGSGGQENFGGEYLISLLSLWILTENQDNKQQVRDNNIPFVVPERAQKPGGLSDALFSKDRIAQANMRIISEHISRDIFEDKTGEVDSATVPVELIAQSGERITVSLVVDYAVLKDKLSLEVEKAVQGFKDSLVQVFESNNEALAQSGIDHFDVKDVYIFRSGNSSRSSLVQQSMESMFSGCSINLIDETENNDKDMRYAITPKTAVAYGQLKLPDIEVVRVGSNFKWNILRKNPANGQYTVVIKRSGIDKTWQYYNKIHDGRCNIAFSEVPNPEKALEHEYVVGRQFKDIDNGYLYIRIADETSIECYASETRSTPDSEQAAGNFERITLIRESNND